MSFDCDWCGKTFNRQYHLNRHKFESKIPCNFKCRTCFKQFETKYDYKKHLKKCVEAVPISAPVSAPQMSHDLAAELPDENDMSPIPFEDFDVEFIQDVRIVGYERDGAPVTFLNDGSDGSPAEVGKLDNYNVKIQVYRAVRAKKAVNPQLMYRAMESLEREMPKEKLQYIATNMMHDVLRQNKDPRLHSVCMSDINRGTVRALQRTPATPEKTVWAAYSKSAGLDVVNDLTRKLFSFFLEAGAQSVKAARWTMVDVECVGFPGAAGWSVILYEDRFTGLEVKRAPNHQVDYDATRPPSPRLLQLIQARKDEVFEKLKELIIAHKDLEECLRQSRQFCLPTMKENM